MSFWSGKVVLVTGASRGIGLAMAEQLAEKKANLVLVARNAAKLNEVADRLSLAGAGCAVVAGDVRDKSVAVKAVNCAVDNWQRLDALINNAGIGLYGAVEALDGAMMQEAMTINVIGPLNFVQAAVPVFRQQQIGLIVNIASLGAIQVAPHIGGYAATKAALAKVSEALRLELRADGIRVCTVYPGSAQTEFRSHALGAAYGKNEPRLSRVIPDQVAKIVLEQAALGRREIFITTKDRAFAALSRIMPAGVESLVHHVFQRKERT